MKGYHRRSQSCDRVGATTEDVHKAYTFNSDGNQYVNAFILPEHASNTESPLAWKQWLKQRRIHRHDNSQHRGALIAIRADNTISIAIVFVNAVVAFTMKVARDHATLTFRVDLDCTFAHRLCSIWKLHEL